MNIPATPQVTPVDKCITELPYSYRDASNYKAHSFIYLDGKLHNAEIAKIEEKLEALQDRESFIPFDLQLDIRELQSELTSFPSSDDHVFHELNFDEIKYLDQAPADVEPIELTAFMAAIRDISSWNIEAAEERLGLAEDEDEEKEVLGNGPEDLETVFEMARQHGEDSDPDHEVGDLQELLRQAWEIMSPDQRLELLQSDGSTCIFEINGQDNPFIDNQDSDQLLATPSP